ncbi:MAG: sugar phosphatase [Rouxiella aceris]|uniref:sugar phosphatase n=1 Tax=Rouxiella aceris TaxID=2703884 RepID=UPI0028411DD0|nr:sugar phosphatase [Rouxiella aceris]MDR3432940.1 sugar phosphatase [Rouxiella aceris]
MKCKGFLFDLDGTLVDSLPAVERAWINWALSRDIDPQEVLSFIHGKQAITSLRHFMPGASEAEVRQQFLLLESVEARDTEGVAALPGAHDLLSELTRLEIPWAIVTSGSLPVASARHAAANLPMPEVFVTAEQVEQGKPHPEAYLLGAARLGLSAADCVVVEDAPAGVQSGLAAGCKVIAVNAPADTPNLDKVDFALTSLAVLALSADAHGVTVSLK